LPLAGAVFKGAAGVVTALLEHGAAVDAAGPDGRTPLMMAAMFNRDEMVEALLRAGADREAKDASGATAAQMAWAMGARNALSVLEE
ncbi:ankyrin repeat domain-containing protein, partial [Bacillus atrophaeus ATCC 9372]